MMSSQRLKKSALLLVLALSVVACGAPQEPTVSPNSSPNSTGVAESPSAASTTASNVNYQTDLLVVTTVAPITNIVSNIAGDRVRVVGIIPEGTDSHTFEPRPSDGETLAKANLVFVNGLSLEQPTMELAESVKPQDTKAAILILAKGCSSTRNAGIVRTSQRAKRARTVERTGGV
jgi:ABC-type Zn uptake system ZnuABC Zn-binding protein ZnuA